jgi:hypothetical protein
VTASQGFLGFGLSSGGPGRLVSLVRKGCIDGSSSISHIAGSVGQAPVTLGAEEEEHRDVPELRER